MAIPFTMAGLQSTTAAAATPSSIDAKGVATAATALSSLFGALGSYEQGKFQRQQMQFNARLAEMKAEDAIKRGREAEDAYRAEVRKLIGRQRSSYASQGVEVNADTAMDVQAETAELGEMDALTIRANAMREAFGYRMEALNFGAASRMSLNQSLDQAGATLLTGGMQAIDMWRRFGG